MWSSSVVARLAHSEMLPMVEKGGYVSVNVSYEH